MDAYDFPCMKARTSHALCVTLLLLSSNLLAQESAAQRHEMATNQLKGVAAEISLKCLSDLQSLDDWKKQRQELRRHLLELLALVPLLARTLLKAQFTRRLARD